MNCLADGLTSLLYLKKLILKCEGSTPGAITVLLDGLQYLNVNLNLTFAHLSVSDVVELGRGLVQLTINGVHKLNIHIAVYVLRVRLL